MMKEPKERPILFNGEMVRAILDGRKTMTRRVMKPQPYMSEHPIITGEVRECLKWQRGKSHGTWLAWESRDWKFDPMIDTDCPYGRPGDILYVKETWKPGAWREDGRIAIDYRATPEITNTPWVEIPEDYTGKGFDELWLEWTDELLAAGSLPNDEGYHHWEPGKSPLKWRPSIFMPRWASRLTLRVTAVRVERVQDIGIYDIAKEGLEISGLIAGFEIESDYAPGDNPDEYYYAARDEFAILWDSINAKGGYSFESNCFVWVVEFEPLTNGERP